MTKNQTLGHRDEMKARIERPPIREFFRAIKDKRLIVFTELHELSGDEYQKKLNELR